MDKVLKMFEARTEDASRVSFDNTILNLAHWIAEHRALLKDDDVVLFTDIGALLMEASNENKWESAPALSGEIDAVENTTRPKHGLKWVR